MSGDDRTEAQEDSEQRGESASSIVAHVNIVFGSGAGMIIRLGPAGARFGRETTASGADVALADGRVSRLHARIAVGSTEWLLTDLGSRNGGFVNGAPFGPNAEVELSDRAVVRLGDTLMVFRAEAAADPDGAEDDPVFPGLAPEALAVRRRLRNLAKVEGPLLITGETGTGKERVARWFGTSGSGLPFVPQNCAQLSRELAGSALFGHVKGAFTGAAVAKDGLVAEADGGVLFLDELGELPLDVQAELLRFLEDGSYRPLGATQLRQSQVRVVGATNLDLEEAVRSGAFRRDLLARLRAASPPLELPALRDRPEDVLPWARRFLGEAIGESPPEPFISAGAAECFLVYQWPENLRELRGTLRGLVEAGPHWPIETTALPERLRAHRRMLRTPDDPEPASTKSADPEREEIEAALLRTCGRMKPASELLGVERRRLYRLCERLSIDVERFRRGDS